jgi:hypothetical protein
MLRRGLLLALAAPITAATGSGQQLPMTCVPTSDSLRTPAGARVGSGTFDLILVATFGSRAGDSARGTLTLRRARSSDRSPRTGQRPNREEDRRHVILWGYSSLNFAKVGAPVPDSSSSYPPAPTSEDLLFPGVIGLVQSWDRTSLPHQNMLLVGSAANVRADLEGFMADGPGIVLRVRRLDTGSFSGTWGAVGFADVGGYFCSQRVPTGQ